MVEEKSEQEIIEEIINSVNSRKYTAWIYNLTFSEDDWEDDFDTMIEATEALNDALDDNGREDCEWGIDEVKTYNQIEIELIVKKALQKGKELERDRQLLEGHEACNLAVVDKIGLIKEQASKIAELEKELETIGEALNTANEGKEKQGKYAVELFDEVKRLQKENKELRELIDTRDNNSKWRNFILKFPERDTERRKLFGFLLKLNSNQQALVTVEAMEDTLVRTGILKKIER